MVLHHGRRHGEPFPAMLLPFGALVDFLPTPRKDGSVYDDKIEARMKPGLFVGWKLAPGGKWTGDYYVVDFQQFVAHLHDGRVVGEQTIKEVFL